MNYQTFVVYFQQQTSRLSHDRALNFALKIVNLLRPDYQEFFQVYKFGNPAVMGEALQLCEESKTSLTDNNKIVLMRDEVYKITPDTDDYGEYLGSYALNAAVAVFHCLQFLIDCNLSNIHAIGISYYDTVYFKILEKEESTPERCEHHPDMVRAMNFLLDETR